MDVNTNHDNIVETYKINLKYQRDTAKLICESQCEMLDILAETADFMCEFNKFKDTMSGKKNDKEPTPEEIQGYLRILANETLIQRNLEKCKVLNDMLGMLADRLETLRKSADLLIKLM